MSEAGSVLDQQKRGQPTRVLAFPVIIYLVAIMLPIGFSIGPLNLNGVRVVLIFLIIPLAIRLISGRSGELLLTDLLFFLHLLWLLIAMAVNNPHQTITFFGSQAIEFLGGYLLGRVCIRTREDFVALCRLLVILLCLTLPFAIFEAVTGRALILQMLNVLPNIHSEPNVNAGMRFGLHRAQGMFEHPILYGLFAALVFSFAFVALKNVYQLGSRYIWSALIALCVFCSLSGGPLMAFTVQLILIGWAALFRQINSRWLLLLGAAIIMYVAVDILSTRDPIRVFLTYATFSTHTAWSRINIFNYGMENVWDNPIFGLGLKEWARPFWMGPSMDNFWLVQAVRYGIPGFAFIATGYLIALWRIGRRDFDVDPFLWQLRRGWMIAFVGLTFTLTTVHIWTSVYSFVFFLFGAGMWMMTATPVKGSPPTITKRGSSPISRRRESSLESSSTSRTVRADKMANCRSHPYTRFASRRRKE